MRKISFALAAILTFGFADAFLTAQPKPDSVFSRLELCCGLQRPPQKDARMTGKIEEINLAENNFGWARSNKNLWRTTDNGKTWQEISTQISAAQIIAGVSFADDRTGFAVLSNHESGAFELARTIDGGASWTKQNIYLPSEILAEANFNRISLNFSDSSNGFLGVRLASSSNFTRAALFSTADGGATWRLDQKLMESGEVSLDARIGQPRTRRLATVRANNKIFEFPIDARENFEIDAPLAFDESVTAVRFSNTNGWLLAESGRCEIAKTNCEQTARILATDDHGKNWYDATPAEAGKKDKRETVEKGNFAAPDNSSFSLLPVSPFPLAFPPPLGATRISVNRGFDKCTAATAAQMQIWWDNSPFTDANIYIAGRNRGCAQPQLTAAWVSQVSAMGYGLIPTVVGYQAPCSVSTNSAKHSSDPTIAETQGREEADIAIAAANNLGLTTGTVLYYDMERYDETSATPGCRDSVKAFLKGWTDRVKELGYISGVYGSPTNAVGDWINIPAASRMDAIWMARWDNVASVWQYNSPSPAIPTNVWNNHQRIKQWQAPHNETWGGVTFNIDGNLADAPVAGARAAKNKPGDFDGDGKTDFAVYRPGENAWYVLNSGSGVVRTAIFGLANDTTTPGDFDGDGRTDYAVFRPETGVWFELSANPARPAANVIRARQFGLNGDVPVAADYDGDNIADLAVFRSGVWHITNSFDPRTPNYRVEQFGLSGDIPTPGDYDADGKADLAVFRPATGVWYVMRSRDGFYAAQFGANGDRPVQGDYDGDGKTDIAVWRPENGVWYILKSGGEVTVTQFGLLTDQPTPGDFDADNKWDLGVFRPETGVWYVQQSQNGFQTAQFGIENDRPIPGGYIPQ